ncbi:hypothetical protein [Shouchella clausii]|nr:hypothetical protein [Shouchella clausii]
MALTLLAFGWSSPILDANASSEQLNQIGDNINEVNDAQRIQKVKDLTDAAVSNNDVVFNSNNTATLDYENANVADINKNNENFTAISIPVVGEEYSLISNLTLIFDSNNEIINYTETLFTKSDNDKFVLTSYNEGELIHDRVTDIDYVSNSELKKELEYIDDEVIQPQGLNEVALCLSTVLLIDLTLARMVATACMAACASGVGAPICAACIGGLLAVGAGNITAVTNCFKLF